MMDTDPIVRQGEPVHIHELYRCVGEKYKQYSMNRDVSEFEFCLVGEPANRKTYRTITREAKTGTFKVGKVYEVEYDVWDAVRQYETRDVSEYVISTAKRVRR